MPPFQLLPTELFGLRPAVRKVVNAVPLSAHGEPVLQLYVLPPSWTLLSLVFNSHTSALKLSVTVPSPLSTKRAGLAELQVLSNNDFFVWKLAQFLKYVCRHFANAAESSKAHPVFTSALQKLRSHRVQVVMASPAPRAWR